MRDGWRDVSFGDVLYEVRRPVQVSDLVDIPFAGVRWYAEGVYPRDIVPASVVKTRTLSEIRTGDILYNRMWATKASFGIVRQDSDGCLVTNDFPCFRADEDAVLTDYIGLVFQWARFQQEASMSATGTTERRRLHERDFLKLRFPLPPLDEQRRIVDLIGAIDNVIEGLSEQLTKSPYTALLKAVAARYPMEQISTVVHRSFAGGTPSRKRSELFGGHIPWLKSGEVENDEITTTNEFITDAGLAVSAARLVPPGATVVAMYGQGDTKGRAGFVVQPVTTNQAVLALVPDEGVITPRFLLHAVRSQTEALRARAVGAAQPNLSKDLVMSQVIPVPPLPEQRDISELLDAVRMEMTGAKRTLDLLLGVRLTLLSVLLNGEHVVPESYDELMEEVA